MVEIRLCETCDGVGPGLEEYRVWDEINRGTVRGSGLCVR